MAVRNRVCGPTQGGIIDVTRGHEGRMQTRRRTAYAGSRLKPLTTGKAPLGKPAFQPYWGKLAVRNDRGDRGNVGIIRSPVRASILPDRERSLAGFKSRGNSLLPCPMCYRGADG